MPVDNGGRRDRNDAALEMRGRNAVRGRYRRQREGRTSSCLGTGRSLPINLRGACAPTYTHAFLELEHKRLHDDTKGSFIEHLGGVATARVEARVRWIAVDEPSKVVSLWDLWTSGQIRKKRSATSRAGSRDKKRLTYILPFQIPRMEPRSNTAPGSKLGRGAL